MSIDNELRDAVVEGDGAAAVRLVRQSLEGGTPADAILQRCLVAAMDEAGRRFEAGEFFVPELLVAARAMKAAMTVLDPLLAGTASRAAGRIAIGTVQGDLHDIGKNLVATMLRGSGFDVVDLGSDVTPERFVAAAREGAQLIALSALLTTTMLSMKEALSALDAAGLRPAVRVMVGGAPVTPQYAESIGADGFADNAAAAVTLARRLLAQAAGTSGASR